MQGAGGTHSPLALSRSEQIKSDPLSLSGVETCQEALWKVPGYVNVMVQRE